MVTFSVISDENEKLKMKSIDNGVIALHCVMCKRVMPEESASFDIVLTQLVSTYFAMMSRSLLRSLPDCCSLPQ